MAPSTTMTPPSKGNGEQQVTALATPKPSAAMTRRGIEPQTLDEAYRFAQALARSSIIPSSYQKNPDNCLVALDVAARTGSNWLAVMQHLGVINGRPAFDANFTVGLVNQSGQFEPIQYEEAGENPKDPSYRVRAYSKRRGSDIVLYGPWIDWPTVKAEGWDSKSGSKWKSGMAMVDQMFHYRAGAWWQKRHCPEMTLGMPTTEELEDSPDMRKQVESHELKPTNGRQSFGFGSQQPTGDVQPDEPPTQPIEEPTADQPQEEPTMFDEEAKPKFVCPQCAKPFVVKPAKGLCPDCDVEVNALA